MVNKFQKFKKYKFQIKQICGIYDIKYDANIAVPVSTLFHNYVSHN